MFGYTNTVSFSVLDLLLSSAVYKFTSVSPHYFVFLLTKKMIAPITIKLQ
jgi:hypothetical protein